MSSPLRVFLRPSPRARDAFMGLGGLLLILAIIALAGSTFTFDEARRALLRPLGLGLAIVGALCWARGSFPSGSSPE